MIVKDRMDRHLLTLSATESCERALALMEAAGVDSLPVVEGTRLIGVVSELDIRRRAPRSTANADTNPSVLFPYVRVMGVMTYAPPSCAPSTSLAEAAALMLGRGLSALPVIERGRLVGIITMDALRATLPGLLESAGAAAGDVHAPTA